MSSDHFPYIGISADTGMKSFAGFVGLLVVVVTAGCGGGSRSQVNNNRNNGPVAATVSSTIAVGTAPSAIAVDSAANKLYLTDFGTQPAGSGTQFCSPTGADISVIDGATESPTSTSVAFGFVPGKAIQSPWL